MGKFNIIGDIGDNWDTHNFLEILEIMGEIMGTPIIYGERIVKILSDANPMP